MNDKIFYPVMAAIAVLLIALSFVWPQGIGMPSPKPFGHALVLPDYFRMVKDREARQHREAADKAKRARQTAQNTAAASSDSASGN